MEIIAIANQKGGCAKTTTTANLGACLAQLEKKVLLIDNDPQGNLTSNLGVKEYNNTLYDCIINDLPLQEAIIHTEFGVDIVPSDINYSNAEGALFNVDRKEFLFKDLFNKSTLDYDYILIDCSPSLSLTTINALVAADSTLTPLEASIFNFEGLAQLIKILKLVTANYNPGLKTKGVLLTRVDSRSSLGKDFRDQLKEIFGKKLFDTMIHQNTSLVRSQIQKKPITHYDRSSKGYKEYIELAQEVINRG